MKHKWNVVLGFYQDKSTANEVIKSLKKSGFFRFAYLHRYHEKTIVNYPYFFCRVRPEIISSFKDKILADETLILIQIKTADVRKALQILRQVEYGHPISFLLRSETLNIKKDDLELLAEPLTNERLNEKAVSLAEQLSDTYFSRKNYSLLHKLQEISKILNFLKQDISEAEFIEQTITTSAEWFLDNVYVIQNSIEEIQRNLPKKFYKELPKVAYQNLYDLPRIYIIAKELVNYCSGKIDRTNTTAFLKNYQSKDTLTMGELWALPLMLRLRLVECIETLGLEIDKRLRDGELANFWGNRLLNAARREPDRLESLLEDLKKEQQLPSFHFAEELLDHLYDEGPLLTRVKAWLENRLGRSSLEIIHQKQIQETIERVTFSNAIISLITLSQITWSEIFEETSVVNSILNRDPSNVYPKMDFETRDKYRHVVERLAKITRLSEKQVANKTIEFSLEGSNELTKHIGFYLIDEGLLKLEKELKCYPTFFESCHRWIQNHSSFVYLGGIFILTFLIEGFLFNIASKQVSFYQALAMCLLSLLPSSELSVQFLNLLLTNLLPPSILPKMCYEKGIPQECKTLIVVPVLLNSVEGIKEEVEQLEIRFLANQSPNLLFGLFGDLTDSASQFMDSDHALLETAKNEIEALEKKYQHPFFLFHRNRSWSPDTRAWIGKERKRGKLEELNRFLIDQSQSENLVYYGPKEALKDITYVITLDADTQLPKNKAQSLIETISHPLNKPYLSADHRSLARGYTIIQPRISTDYPQAKATYFSWIFSEPFGIDPYTQAISDIYQDLTNEGTYHGKGIYDLKTFSTLLNHRFPEEHLLSHDLIEGSYTRVGFASDIVLFDSFPKDYFSWSKRQHRWMRGDWQIIDWLFPKVPTSTNQKEANSLSLINRWKIFDNLRRSLMPVSILFLLFTAWIHSPIEWVWTELVILVLLVPAVSAFLCDLLKHPYVALLTWKEPAKGILRAIINAAMLPYQAWISLDAILRVIYRRVISHRHLLEWETDKSVNKYLAVSQNKFLYQLCALPFFALMALLLVLYVHPNAIWIALPFYFLWIFSPLIIYALNKPLIKRPDKILTEKERKFLRKVARKTWRYFDDFVGPQSHWLPPDNYQAALGIEIAQRTSPTNIGLGFLSVLSAHDFGYITIDELINRTSSTTQTLNKLEFFEGHLLNWYDIQQLAPLYPRYVSSVDTGNFLASLWTFEQGIEQIISSPLLSQLALEGLIDTLEIITTEEKVHLKVLSSLQMQLKEKRITIYTIIKAIKNLIIELQNIPLQKDKYWSQKLEQQLQEWMFIIDRYFSWVDILTEISIENLILIDPSALQLRDESFREFLSLQSLGEGHFTPSLKKLLDLIQKPDLPIQLKDWSDKLKEALLRSQWLAGEKLGQVHEMLQNLHEISKNTNLNFLYNQERKLFSIGYHVDDRKLDVSHYDLLASEARITSLIGIAKGDIPLDHWWALGRPFHSAYGLTVLLSWGGTMFEFLMPLLFTKHYEDSLLGNACNNAVLCQQLYANKRGIPWGISESAYSEIDQRKTYQYRSFGVPGLGLKRGLENDLVVSPYSSALALAVNPKAAIKNLQRIAKDFHGGILNIYGYFEAIDFTRQSTPRGERGVIIFAYMAHHQGMSLISINNLLNNNVMSGRFHNDPSICGVESLLYEKVPLNPSIATSGRRKEIPLSRLTPFTPRSILGVTNTPNSPIPKVNLLSNHEYSLVVTNSGGGYSRWKEFELTRWRSDTTCDAWGNFCYIKDIESGAIWSSTYHPTLTKGQKYTVSFKSDKVEFLRRDFDIETLTEIVVSPEDNAEIRLMTFANLSSKKRSLELTSYMELSLAPHLADRLHPCFNKLFIETEAIPEQSGLLAFRRLRSKEDSPIWAFHVVAMNQTIDQLQYETDRTRFIGRGRSLLHPNALDCPLSNSQGTVLDPIFSLRRMIVLEPGQRIQVAFITGCANNREQSIELIKKYKNLNASHRALEMAWTQAQLEIRHLRIHQEDAQLFQKLASRMLYPSAQLRTSADMIFSNRLGQTSLWKQGISGDLPIIVVTIGDLHDMDVVKQTLVAHAFWKLRGLKADLIILNEEDIGYDQPLFEQLKRLIQGYGSLSEIEKPGGIFLRNIQQIPQDEIALILTTAEVVLVAARGTLRQQLVSSSNHIKYPPNALFNKKSKDERKIDLPFLELSQFNGIGGFSKDGSTYSIYLGPNMNTPSPWINVLANPQFGTLISEKGLGCSWFGNSQTNRLTPWSNDPLLDPITDTIYIRDDDRGAVWCPTPGPIRETDPYRITHGQGFTNFEHNSHEIEQNLCIFVPTDESGGLPLRIQRLRLTNKSSQSRKLSITSYSELVLGVHKEDTQLHVTTEWDSESQTIFARNRYHFDFGEYLAFLGSSPAATSFTGDRTEFLGRNNSTSNPSALNRKQLSGKVGAGLDPCAALQVKIVLEPNETKEIIFVLGYALDPASARQMMLKCNDTTKIDLLFQDTQEFWKKTVQAIQIDTPDETANFAINHWLLYQNLSCRYWGRSAFYQSSGAYGFRDQLQDSMALVYSKPELAREHLLKAASRQFVEGDVQHWWHPPSGGGIRTKISDDLLWLPYAAAHYVRITGDSSILQEQVAFLTGPLLQNDQHELYFIPEISSERDSLLEHCRRALKKGLTAGPHGLPLMGSGDWNDGMNLVGIEGKGESVWLAWFLIHVMNDFSELLSYGENKEAGDGFRIQATRLAESVEKSAWDGAWYLRAFFDNGDPLGSHNNLEASIDSLAQTWAVISEGADQERARIALRSLREHLVKEVEGLVLLLNPPFDHSEPSPGYIRGYPPGVRENGGQYTHGSLWAALAFAKMGDGDTAVKLLQMMHPSFHTKTQEDINLYKIEPYAVAGDIYALSGQVGRGGWSWYTGAAGWFYRIWIEEIFGFQLRGNKLTLCPTIPSSWEKLKLTYRYKNTSYEITIENPSHICRGEVKIMLDGNRQASSEITLIDDRDVHIINCMIEKQNSLPD